MYSGLVYFVFLRFFSPVFLLSFRFLALFSDTTFPGIFLYLFDSVRLLIILLNAWDGDVMLRCYGYHDYRSYTL